LHPAQSRIVPLIEVKVMTPLFGSEKNRAGRFSLLLLAIVMAVCGGRLMAAAPEKLLDWPSSGQETRPWGYWWWMGSAVDEANLTREMQRYRDAGMGGVHIIPIYGAKGYESLYLEYLSPAWMRMLNHAVSEGRRLDMGVDMTLGTGWCFGGPAITENLASAAAVVKTADVAAGAAAPADILSGPLQALVADCGQGKVTDLTGRIRPGEAMDWRAGSSPCRLYAVSQKPGARVKRAAPGGQGFMLNPFHGPAIRTYLERFESVFNAYSGLKPRGMYHDSFEYGANWAPDLFAQFEKRRGYRLQPELASLFGDQLTDRAARVKSDYRETLSDLLVEDFTPTWVNWSHKHGFITRNQAHGSPASLLDLYAAVDVPETEMFNRDRSTVISKFASSAAHVAGRKLVASETGTWLAEHFNETLAGLKDLLDQLFVSGVNHVVYHGTIYSPDDAPWPGWLFYASTQMNPRSAIWRDAPTLNTYIQRCQTLLQFGKPDNDILLYWPIYDVWHNPKGLHQNYTVHQRSWVEDQPAGRLAESLLKRGYSFDFVSDRQLFAATAGTGHTQVTGGRYPILLVPSTNHMPLPTLERLLALAKSGATVAFQDRLPPGVPGYKDVEQRAAQLRTLLDSVTLGNPNAGVREARLGNGRILVGETEACLAAAGARREALADRSGLNYIRRASPAGSFYFISNRGSEAVDGWVPLSAGATSAALLDPMTGRTGIAASRKAGQATEVYLQLEPGASIFVRTSSSRASGSRWSYFTPAGAAIPVQGTWNVSFIDGGPDLPSTQKVSRLASWTESGGESVQRFAGTAVYSIRFDAPSGVHQWLLELGDVRESARVRLNGRNAGALIAPPFRVVLDGLKPKDNLLEVEVTNTSANRLRDLDLRKVPWKIFHDINIVNLDYKPLIPSNWPLRESGLLGPVMLRPLSRLDPAQVK
jgi:hypothetical protein